MIKQSFYVIWWSNFKKGCSSLLYIFIVKEKGMLFKLSLKLSLLLQVLDMPLENAICLQLGQTENFKVSKLISYLLITLRRRVQQIIDFFLQFFNWHIIFFAFLKEFGNEQRIIWCIVIIFWLDSWLSSLNSDILSRRCFSCLI